MSEAVAHAWLQAAQRARRERFFTPLEAAELLPEIQALALEAAVQSAVLDEALAELRGGTVLSPLERRRRASEVAALRDQIRAITDEMTELGVELESLRPVLVSFPALRDGREVQLCWREGELAVAHWRNVHESIRERLPIQTPGSARWVWLH